MSISTMETAGAMAGEADETWFVVKRCVRRLPPSNELALLTVRQTATTGQLRVDVLVPRINHLTTLKPGEATVLAT